MDEFFKIHLEQLKEGRKINIDFDTGPEFLDVHEADLSFESVVTLKGEAYLADEALILRLDIATAALVSCAICNEACQVPIHLLGFYHAELIEAIRGGVFSFKDLVREEILLDLPLKAECGGNCPAREELAHYFKL